MNCRNGQSERGRLQSIYGLPHIRTPRMCGAPGNCCGLVVQTSQPSQSDFSASEQRNETLRAWSVAIHLLHWNGGESVARRLRGLVCAEIRRDDNQRGSLGPFICNLPRLFSSLLRQLQLCQIVAWTSGVAGALSVANKNGAHKSTLRGAESTRPETRSSAGFTIRSPVARRPQGGAAQEKQKIIVLVCAVRSHACYHKSKGEPQCKPAEVN
jgi:hypothetical protein